MTVAKVNKNSTQHVVYSIRRYKGHQLVSVRVFEHGVATKHGLALQLEQVDQAIASLLACKHAWQEFDGA